MKRRRRPRILVIDDDPDIVHLVGLYLAKSGFRVLSASSGEEGLRIAEAELPDLILLDLMMPGMDGMEVCRLVKGNAATQRIPIVILTAKTRIQDAVACFQLGAVNYLIKPFLPKELVAQLKAALPKDPSEGPA